MSGSDAHRGTTAPRPIDRVWKAAPPDVERLLNPAKQAAAGGTSDRWPPDSRLNVRNNSCTTSLAPLMRLPVGVKIVVLRIPTLAISPWISPGGLGSQMFPAQSFDHTSIIRTALQLLNIGGNLTERNKAAPSFAPVCSLAPARTDLPTIPAPARPTPAAAAGTSAAEAFAPPESTAKGFSRIAMSLDLRMAQAHGLPPVAAAHPTFTAPTTSAPSVADRVDSATSSRPAVAAARTNQQTLDYIQAVAERVGQLRTSDEIPIVMASIPSAVKS